MNPDSVEERSLSPLFDVGALWVTLWQRRLVVLATAGAVFALALAYLAVTTPTYTVTASLLIDPRDQRTTNLNDVLPGIGADSAAITSQISIIESEELLSAVMADEHIATDPEFSGSGLLSQILSVFSSSEPDPHLVAFKRFQSHLGVEREGLTYVIDVSFTSNNAEKAARIANAIVDRYTEGLAGKSEKANSTVSSRLDKKINGLQKTVSDAESAVEEFKVENGIVAAGAGGTLQTQIDQVSAQILTAQAEVDQANNQYNLAQAAGTSPNGLARLSAILSSPTAEKLRDEYNRSATALANFSETYGPRHPAMARMQSELDKIKTLMAVEAQRITSDLKARRDVAAQNVARLQARLNDLRARSNQSDVSQVQLRQLERQADAARAVLDDFMKRAAETSHIGGLQLSQVQKIGATTPVQPTWPKPALLLPVSAVLGLLAGCGLALTLGPVDAEAGAPLFRGRRSAGSDEIATTSGASLPRPAGKLVDWGTCRLHGIPPGPAQTVIRAVRAGLFQDGHELLSADVDRLARQVSDRLGKSAAPRIIVASSLHDGVERRLVATTLGLAFRYAGKRVLIVELSEGSGQFVAGLATQTAPQDRVFTDAASGLPTVVRRVPAAHGRRPLSEAGALGRVLAQTGGGYDVMIVLDRPMTEGSWEPPALALDADLVLFALSPVELDSSAVAALEACLSKQELERSAMLVMAPADAPAGRDARQSAAAPDAPDARRSAFG
jgi:uncharacterized protein involved in exopolysaccharide biosynthesis